MDTKHDFADEKDLSRVHSDELIGTYDDIEIDQKTRDALVRKLDWRLMPLLCTIYALQSIDKTTLGYAAVFNLRQDLHLDGVQFSWVGGIFYLGYLIWEFPINILLQKYPINRVMAITAILWGAILCCHAAVNNFAGLMAVRTLLGAFEASINPGTMLLFSMYYERSKQPLRMGIWIGSAGLGYVIAGIASFGLGHIPSRIHPWQILFLFWGFVTIAFGVFLMFFLPESPLRAKFLSEDERQMVVAVVKTNGSGLEDKKFKWPQFFEAMRDPKTWLLFLFAVASNCPNGGLTVFQGLVIKGMGFSTFQTTLVQMPSGAFMAVLCPLACYFASRFRDARIAIMLACLMPFLAGVLGLWLIASTHPYARLGCLWISFAYTATWTLSMSVAVANTAGHTKKITTNAMLLIGYCTGNFTGPFFFKAEQAPRYPLGVTMMLVCVSIQIMCLLALLGLLYVRNRSRSAEHLDSEENRRQASERGMRDETDLQNKYFRYVY